MEANLVVALRMSSLIKLVFILTVARLETSKAPQHLGCRRTFGTKTAMSPCLSQMIYGKRKRENKVFLVCSV